MTWAKYLGDLAAACGGPPPQFSLLLAVADSVARVLELAWRAAGRRERPLMTREAARLLGMSKPGAALARGLGAELDSRARRVS